MFWWKLSKCSKQRPCQDILTYLRTLLKIIKKSSLRIVLMEKLPRLHERYFWWFHQVRNLKWLLVLIPDHSILEAVMLVMLLLLRLMLLCQTQLLHLLLRIFPWSLPPSVRQKALSWIGLTHNIWFLHFSNNVLLWCYLSHLGSYQGTKQFVFIFEVWCSPE